ncbi:zinc finger protein 14 [Lingula anatina]|uniref:Zinc finger protein 14 n=1 Tax=Lingula anatina TaxID=7574 RepID=A0A1S3KAX0_LINAN|nr:zinc finger protein 14 [Lingula anatina]|eukprot:XP_013419793.1 zinc finger protein 14 [Lingula anatina]
MNAGKTEIDGGTDPLMHASRDKFPESNDKTAEKIQTAISTPGFENVDSPSIINASEPERLTESEGGFQTKIRVSEERVSDVCAEDGDITVPPISLVSDSTANCTDEKKMESDNEADIALAMSLDSEKINVEDNDTNGVISPASLPEIDSPGKTNAVSLSKPAMNQDMDKDDGMAVPISVQYNEECMNEEQMGTDDEVPSSHEPKNQPQTELSDCRANVKDNVQKTESSEPDEGSDNGPAYPAVCEGNMGDKPNLKKMIAKCIICGSLPQRSRAKFTKLITCPEIQSEIQELLKLLAPPARSDVCCGRCVSMMKRFLSAKKVFLNLKCNIIALHVDAQTKPKGASESIDEDDHEESDGQDINDSEEDVQEASINNRTYKRKLRSSNVVQRARTRSRTNAARKESQPKLQNISNLYELDTEDHETSDTDNRNRDISHNKKDGEILVKHENIDIGYEVDGNSSDKEVNQKVRVPRSKRKTFKCQHCSKVISGKDELVAHERTHTGEKPFKCRYCDTRFYRKNSCVHHEKKHQDKPFRCKLCVRIFSSEGKLKEHETIHSSVRPYQCQHCDKTFTKNEECVMHERVHTGEKPYQCQFCDKTFHRKRSCVLHEKKKHKGRASLKKNDNESSNTELQPYKCQYCDKIYRRKDELTVHEMNHTGERPFKCQNCDKTFNRKSTFVKHEKKHANKPFRCSHCEKSFSKKVNCAEHEMTHTLPRPFHCQYCTRTFDRKDEWTAHERTHTGERPFKCKICEKTFLRKNSCVKHEKKHMPGNSTSATPKKSITEEDDSSDSEEKKFQCQHCDKTFYEKRNCEKHEKTHIEKKAFICKHCGEGCEGKQALVRHEKTHFGGKPYKCWGCDMSFAIPSRLKEHERIHTGEKPYLCQYCTKKFTQSSTLRLHERTQHTGERPFKCQYCDQRFPTRLYREEHERFHTGEKPFKCDFCDKRFVRKANWRDHVRTHTGIKPHVCSYCGKGFRDRGTCVIHERTHTGERPYGCKYCDKTFIRKSRCTEHEKTHTGEKPVKTQQSVNKNKSQSKVNKSQLIDDTFRNQHPDIPYKSHHSENSFRSHHSENTYRSQHSESSFMGQLSENSYRNQHSDGAYLSQQGDNTFRGPHSSNVFPAPEVVYPPGENPYMYSMFMPGL